MQRLALVYSVFAACAPRIAAVLPSPTPVATPVVTDAVAEEAEVPALAIPVDFKPGTECERCLYMEPAVPKPGDMVMFETQAAPDVTGALLSVYGRDVRMFRVGKRFRAFLGVPLSAKQETYAARLWLAGPHAPAGRPYSCLEHAVIDRELLGSEALRVARRYTSRRTASLHEPVLPIETNKPWVDALEHEPFSQTLFVWPRAGSVNSGFAVNRTYNKAMRTRHMGLDIQGKIGDPAFASQSGIVRFAGRQRATGNTLVIDHGGGILSFYLHLDRTLKRLDDRVKQGELIAYVGSTGRVTGPHLHFAVSVQGRFVDPESVLAHPLLATAPGLPCVPEQSTHSAR